MMMSKKNAVFMMKTAFEAIITYSLSLTAAARRTAGTRLHACQNESLTLVKIDVRAHEHAVGSLFQINLQSV